jgi:DNA repair photolyase
MCTCPPKHSLNPYTGCSHGCLYCYISSYIKDPFRSRPKKNAIREVEREVKMSGEGIRFISLSNSSDPYPPEERILGITRDVLRILDQHGIGFQIVTKSDLVARDLDLMGKNVVSMTVTAKDTRRIEPGAPSSEKRIEALKALSDGGIRCTLRLDPVIPGINDSYESVCWVIHHAGDHVEHVTSSTLKPRSDSLTRLERSFPQIGWRGMYTDRKGGSYYLPEDTRLGLMLKVREACDESGLTFSCCREGFDINTGISCDGSHLLGDAI